MNIADFLSTLVNHESELNPSQVVEEQKYTLRSSRLVGEEETEMRIVRRSQVLDRTDYTPTEEEGSLALEARVGVDMPTKQEVEAEVEETCELVPTRSDASRSKYRFAEWC